MPTSTRTPFSQAVPVRLTYADGLDGRAAISEDGTNVVYTFIHPLTPPEPDPIFHHPDQCIGVLPITGGQRLTFICGDPDDYPTPEGGNPNRIGIEHGALSRAGDLAYMIQVGGRFNFTSHSAQLMLTNIDSPEQARRVFTLKQQPDGGLGRWDYLLNMTWVAPGRLVALAAEATLRQRGAGVVDTIYSGVEVVEFDFSGGEVSWRRLAAAPGAISMEWDPTRNSALILRHDSILVAGIDADLYHATRPPEALFHELTDFGVVNGRLVVTELFTTASGGGDGQEGGTLTLHSRLGTVQPDGHLELLLSSDEPITSYQWFGRLSGGGDGGRIVFEWIKEGRWDLYALDVGA